MKLKQRSPPTLRVLSQVETAISRRDTLKLSSAVNPNPDHGVETAISRRDTLKLRRMPRSYPLPPGVETAISRRDTLKLHLATYPSKRSVVETAISRRDTLTYLVHDRGQGM